MSFRESQHGIVFNPWLCGSPGMPSLLLPPPQRQGIKDTLHLFDLVCLLRLFHSVFFEVNITLLFSCFAIELFGYFGISFATLYDGFFAVIVIRFLSYVGEFLVFVIRVVNNTVYCHYHCESINVIKALRFHFVPQNAKKLCGIRRKNARISR